MQTTVSTVGSMYNHAPSFLQGIKVKKMSAEMLLSVGRGGGENVEKKNSLFLEEKN